MQALQVPAPENFGDLPGGDGLQESQPGGRVKPSNHPGHLTPTKMLWVSRGLEEEGQDSRLQPPGSAVLAPRLPADNPSWSLEGRSLGFWGRGGGRGAGETPDFPTADSSTQARPFTQQGAGWH